MSIITTYSKTSEYCPLVQYKDATVPIIRPLTIKWIQMVPRVTENKTVAYML